MATGAAAAAIVGTGVSIFGQLKAAKDQKRAARSAAEARRVQADEILARSEINIQELKRQAQGFKARQSAAFASSGVDIGSGAPLVAMENTNRVVMSAVENRRKEAAFRAESILRGAALSDQQAEDISKAGKLQAFGTGLSGLAQGLSLLK